MAHSSRVQVLNEMGKVWKSRTGIQDELISQCGPDDRLVKIVKQNHFFTIIKEDEILDMINSNNSLHEIIMTYPRRVYFDVDIKTGAENFELFCLLQDIRNYISTDEVNVYGYETDDKKSYHITLSNTYFENDDERLKFKEYIQFLKDKLPDKFGICSVKGDTIIDTRVYSIRQPLKCIYQSKPDGPVHRELEGCKIRDIKNTFVSLFIGTERLPLFGNISNKDAIALMKEFKSLGPVSFKKSISLEKIEALEMPIVSREEIETATGLLKLCPRVGSNNCDLGHEHRFKVLNFCYWNGITFDEFSNWWNNQEGDKYQIKKRLEKLKPCWNKFKDGEQYKITINSFKKYLGYFYAEMATSDDIQTSRFLSSFNILKPELTTLYDTEGAFVKTDIFNKLKGKQQIYIFNICMGGGKTTTTLQFLKENPRNSFIWFSPRQTLVLNISERMTNEFGIKHLKHLSVGANKKKLREADKLLICNQSLHYLGDDQVFDFIIIDEIESVLNSWSDTKTHGDNMNANFNQFCRLLKQAKKIILLDAFITTKTFNFLRNLLHYNVADCLTLYSNKKPQEKQLIHNENNMDLLIQKIGNEIRGGKKLYIFYSYKTAKDTRLGILELDKKIKKYIKELDLEEATTQAEENKILRIETEDYKNSLIYFAESKEKNDLGDVNEKWAQADYIITNTSITVGVNYEGTDYDKIYLLIAGETSSPRDVIQTSMRIRKTKEDIIETYFFNVFNKEFLPYPKLYTETDNQLFKSLIVDIFAEYHADFVDSFKMFCDKTNYNYSAVPVIQNKTKVKQEKYINDLYECNQLIEYSKIPNVDEATKEFYENRVIDRKATLVERLALEKYYFVNHFHYLIPDSKRLIWNFRGRDFLKGMDNPIITSLLKDNDITRLEDYDFQKMKPSQQTLDLIKQNFSSTIDNKLEAKILNKAINSILGIMAVDSKRLTDGRARGYVFTDLFNTLNNVYKEHLAHIEKVEEDKRRYEEEAKNSHFLEEQEEQQEIEEAEYPRLDDSNPEYARFWKLKQARKPIPKELKHFDLDL